MSEIARPATVAAISFEELLRADEAEQIRWKEWFLKQPDSLLDTPTQIAGAGTLRMLLVHIAGVQYLYSEWLNDLPGTIDSSAIPQHTATEIFSIIDHSRSMLWKWVHTATPEELAKFIEYRNGDFLLRATKRKAFLQVIWHNTHHYAQVATIVREEGNPTDWIHDFIFSPVME